MNRHSAAGARNSDQAGGDKRGRILDAAVRIFAEKGFYNAKVSEIARVAGVADGTIYLYFKSKDDLLISIFEDRMEEVNAAEDTEHGEDDDGSGGLPAELQSRERRRATLVVSSRKSVLCVTRPRIIGVPKTGRRACGC